MRYFDAPEAGNAGSGEAPSPKLAALFAWTQAGVRYVRPEGGAIQEGQDEETVPHFYLENGSRPGTRGPEIVNLGDFAPPKKALIFPVDAERTLPNTKGRWVGLDGWDEEGLDLEFILARVGPDRTLCAIKDRRERNYTGDGDAARFEFLRLERPQVDGEANQQLNENWETATFEAIQIGAEFSQTVCVIPGIKANPAKVSDVAFSLSVDEDKKAQIMGLGGGAGKQAWLLMDTGFGAWSPVAIDGGVVSLQTGRVNEVIVGPDAHHYGVRSEGGVLKVWDDREWAKTVD